MGAINGFNPDRNGDGKISVDELKAMKELGIKTKAFDKDKDGKLDDGVTFKDGSLFVGDKKYSYEICWDGGDSNKGSIFATTTTFAADGTIKKEKVKEIRITEEQIKGEETAETTAPEAKKADGQTQAEIDKAFEQANLEATQGTIKDGKAEITDQQGNTIVFDIEGAEKTDGPTQAETSTTPETENNELSTNIHSEYLTNARKLVKEYTSGEINIDEFHAKIHELEENYEKQKKAVEQAKQEATQGTIKDSKAEITDQQGNTIVFDIEGAEKADGQTQAETAEDTTNFNIKTAREVRNNTRTDQEIKSLKTHIAGIDQEIERLMENLAQIEEAYQTEVDKLNESNPSERETKEKELAARKEEFENVIKTEIENLEKEKVNAQDRLNDTSLTKDVEKNTLENEYATKKQEVIKEYDEKFTKLDENLHNGKISHKNYNDTRKMLEVSKTFDLEKLKAKYEYKKEQPKDYNNVKKEFSKEIEGRIDNLTKQIENEEKLQLYEIEKQNQGLEKLIPEEGNG